MLNHSAARRRRLLLLAAQLAALPTALLGCASQGPIPPDTAADRARIVERLKATPQIDIYGARIFGLHIGDRYEDLLAKLANYRGIINVKEPTNTSSGIPEKGAEASGFTHTLPYDSKIQQFIHAGFSNRGTSTGSITAEFRDDDLEYYLTAEGCYGYLIRVELTVSPRGPVASADLLWRQNFASDGLGFPEWARAKEVLDKSAAHGRYWHTYRSTFRKEAELQPILTETIYYYQSNRVGSKKRVWRLSRSAYDWDICSKAWLADYASIRWHPRLGIY